MAKAKAYRARFDVSFPRVLSRSGEGDNLTEATEGTNYPAGSVITYDSLPRHVRDSLEGDDHPALEPLSDEEADAESQQDNSVDSERGIFIAEHEAEAHALEAGGHIVVPREQQLEALSSGQEYARRYQEAVKQAGYDRRPNQEYLAQDRARVPDHVLHGAETPSGTPHNRGPVQQQVSDEENASEDEQDAHEQATRQRPPLAGADEDTEGQED